MSNFAVIARLEIAPGSVDKALPLLTAHRDRCLKDEPGTLKFDILRARDEETVVMLYELYRDEAAFDLHLSGPSIARFRKEMGELGDTVMKVSGTRCDLVE